MNAAMNNTRTRFLTTTALMTALLCILAPMSVPIGPVPISLTNLVIYLFLYLLDTRRGCIAYLVYMLIGLVGLPVFSGFTGGVAKLAGPTGGYIIGFLPMTLLAGLAVERFPEKPLLCILSMEAATWVPYLFGTAWLAYQAGMSFPAAFGIGVTPFIVIDLIKMGIAALLGPVLQKRIRAIR